MSKLNNIIKELSNANNRLKEALGLEPTQIHKDATIQRFEFTFELAWKTIQSYNRGQGLECRSPRNCFRTAAELKIIKSPETWFEFLEARNLIAHTYNEKIANEVYKTAARFPNNIDSLLDKIKYSQ